MQGHDHYGVRYPKTEDDAKRLVEEVHPGARYDGARGVFVVSGQEVAQLTEDPDTQGSWKLVIQPRDLHG